MTVNEATKGRVLFKEEKLGGRQLGIMIILASVSSFVIMFFVLSLVDDDVAMTAILSLFFTLLVVLAGVQALATRTSSLVIYERGFDNPMPTLKTLGVKDRYIPFSDIKSIHPIQISPFGTSRLIGYSIITTEESRANIREIDENKLRKIRDTMELAMKDAWESKYLEAPYLGFKEMQKMRKQLARSKRDVWVEGVSLMGISFGFFVISVVLFIGTPFMLVAFPVGLVGTILGASRMMAYYTAITHYRMALKNDPSFDRTLRVSKDIETKEDDPLKMIWGYTDDDWKKLEKSVHDKRPWYLMIAGFIILLGSIAVNLVLLMVVLMVIGMVVLISPIAFIPRLERDVRLVKSLVKIELKDGKRIMPEWFETGKGFSIGMPLRKAPEYSDEEWTKLVKASKIRSEKGMAIQMVLSMATMFMFLGLGLALHWTFHFPRIVFFVVIGSLVLIPMVPVFVTARRKHRLDSIEAFEDRSGQRIIPERFRSQIVKSWKAGEKKRA